MKYIVKITLTNKQTVTEEFTTNTLRQLYIEYLQSILKGSIESVELSEVAI